MRVFKLFISMVVAAIDRFAEGIKGLLGYEAERSLAVLYYHAVPREYRARFARQMHGLLQLSTPISIGAAEDSPGGRLLTAVTFDDGFMSVVENALPELRSRNIPCTIFVPTGSIGRRPSWLESKHMDASELVAPTEVLQELDRQPLVQFGSHSVSHPNFTTLTDNEASAELVESKNCLEKILGREVTLFSFPHGAYTHRSLDLARKAGYKQLFSIEPVRLRDLRAPYLVGRIRVEPTDWPIEFRLKVLGAYRWMATASAAKRRLGQIRSGSVAHAARAKRGD